MVEDSIDVDAYLEQHRRKELLRFLTCGSVDDGKSTLIGRLLHDTKMIYEDQLAAVEKDSAKHGTTGDTVDLALLVDGLRAEREQGITIDVAYRYFSTDRRKFIIADCPGHEQYTRNMATGASTCDLAIILVDASKGVLTQTRRHSFIVSLLGIKHVIVAINKMDLVDFDQTTYRRIVDEYRNFSAKLELADVRFIPICALEGDNVASMSPRMSWYSGSSLLHLLETTHIASDRNLIDLRLPVQMVSRPNSDFRGFAGTLQSGVIRRGDPILALPSRKESRVRSIVTFDGEKEMACSPMAITITLEDELDISRGDMLVHPNNVPRQEQTLEAMLVWMSETPLSTGKEYLIKHTARWLQARVSTIRYAVDVNSLRRHDQTTLELNQIGRCVLNTNAPLYFDPYRRNRATGAFIIVDRLSNETLGAGMIIDRAESKKSSWDAKPPDTLSEESSPLSAQERSERMAQKPVTVLLTGLQGSGKTSIAHAIERRLFDEGRTVAVLDGQGMRRGLSRDLGFTAAERSENLRRFAEVAKVFNEVGLVVIGAFVAPHEEIRVRAAEVIGPQQTLIVHVDCSLATCRERDQTGLYERAVQGEIADFPGISAAYETPLSPALRLDSEKLSVQASAEQVIELLRNQGFIR